jgi:hypothetical protein
LAPIDKQLVCPGGSRRISVLMAAACTLLTLAQTGQAAEKQAPESNVKAASLVRLAGTNISLKPPTGFTMSQTFSGFIDPKTNCSLMVTELPAPIDKVLPGFNAEKMKEKNMFLKNLETKNKGTYMGALVEFSQNALGTTVHKYAHVFGNDAFTVVATATMPEGAPPELMERLKEAVNSIVYDTNAAARPVDEGLPYKLNDGALLKKAKRLQNSLIFTKDGKFAPPQSGPLFIAAQSIAEVMVQNKAEYAKKRIQDTAQLKDITVDAEEEVTISGLKGRKVLATGLDTKTGAKTFIYQVMLFPDTGYYLMQGLSDEAQRKELLVEFDKIANSFKLL